MSQAAQPTVSAADRFTALKTDRSDADNRSRQIAQYTLPSLYKDYQSKAQISSRKTPYQGTGARCINSMASSMLLALFPVNATFFKFSPDGIAVDQLAAQAGIERGQLEEGLAEAERTVVNEFETAGIRPVLAEAMKHGVGNGNFLIQLPDEGGAKLYPLNRYVVNRDGMGNIMEIVTVDKISLEMLDDATQAALKMNQNASESPEEKSQTELDLYTHISTDNKRTQWTAFQEINGIVLPESQSTYPIDASPWIPARVGIEDGEDYGTGFVWDYIGDFKSLDNLRKATLKGAAAAAKILWMLDPNSALRAEKITKAESGDVLRGRAQDLTAVQLDKFQDMQFVRQTADELSQKLEVIFGVKTAIQRSGERVTAEEIRMMAQEMDNIRAGAYSILAEEFLLPFVNRLTFLMQKQKRLPTFPSGVIKPRIVVGIAALGRGQDFDKLVRFAQAAQQAAGPQAFAQHIDVTELLARLGAASDISTNGLIKTQDQVQNDSNVNAMRDAAVRAAPNVASAALDQPTPQ